MPEFIPTIVKRSMLSLLNSILGAVEFVILPTFESKPVHTIWIIGPPRSGTTLLYQLLVSRYRLAYLSNFSGRFFRSPVIASWLAEFLFASKSPVVDFTSSYGRISGWQSPHEAGQFWYRWFPRGKYVYVPPGVTPQAHLNQLRQEVAGISEVMQGPTLFKNVYNSMRIAPIVEAFPDANFLVLRRDPVDIVQSILRAREETSGNKSDWWSLPPREIDEIETHPYWEQVVEQVYYVYNQIEEDKKRFGVTQFFDVPYEVLCQDTHGILVEVEHFLNQRKVCLQKREEVPVQFPVSSGQKVSDEEYRLIKTKVEELWE